MRAPSQPFRRESLPALAVKRRKKTQRFVGRGEF